MKNTKRGFTIVELVIVIAVIAILAAILIPVFSDVITKANTESTKAEIKNSYSKYCADQALANETYGAIDAYIYFDGTTAYTSAGEETTKPADNKLVKAGVNGYDIYSAT